jgi:hypothetical protein
MGTHGPFDLPRVELLLAVCLVQCPLNSLQMSCLDTFCISHFKERDDFIGVTEKGLTLDKADFSEKGYNIDESKYPRNPDKAVSSSGNGKKKVDELIDLFDDDEDEVMWEDPKAIGLGKEMLEEHTEEEYEEVEVGSGEIPLEGCQL